MRRWIAVLALLLVALPIAAQGRKAPKRPAPPRRIPAWESSYRQAMLDVQINNWTNVRTIMQSVRTQNPVEGGKLVLQSGRVVEYLPHFYYGLASYRVASKTSTWEDAPLDERTGNYSYSAEQVQDYRDAAAAFAESERQGVVRQYPDLYAALRKYRARAEFLQVRGRSGRWEGEVKTSAWRGFFDRVVAPFVTLHATSSNEIGILANGIRNVRASLGMAQSQREDEARHLQIERQNEEKASLAKEMAKRRVDRRIEAARSLMQVAAPVKAGAVTAAAAALQRQINFASYRITVATASELKTIEDDLASEVEKLRATLSDADLKGAPPTLAEAASAFFAGDYEWAITLLEAAEFADPRAVVHALTIRAAARHALYLAGGESSVELRDRAMEDIRNCRRVDPAFAPSDRFSPRFRELFSTTS